MPALFGKSFDDITIDDILNLIEQEVSERQNLEYKETTYGRDDEGTREMLRDISSMANAYGGCLILGLREEKESGVPVEIVGVEKASEERDRILNSCLSNIDRRIAGLRARTIDTDKGAILIVYIPRSTKAPHMITFKGSNQFWVRHDRQKSKMSVDEIREAFFKTESLMKDIDDFLSWRKSEILEEIAENPFYIIASTPVLVKDDIVDITDQNLRRLLQNPPNQTSGWNLNFGPEAHPPRPTLHGLKVESKDSKCVEIFRNGHFELKAKINEDHFIREVIDVESVEVSVLYPYALIEYVVSFFRSLKAIREYLGIDDPLVSLLSMYNIKNFGLRECHPEAIPHSMHLEVWPKQHLEIPPMQMYSLTESDKVAKDFADRIWQAFGYEFAPLFEEGKFNPCS